jgi:hypothetical protein
MATKTFYVLTTTAATPNWFGSLQENGSAPAGANTAFGWTIGASAVASWRARLGAVSRETANQAASYIDATSGPTAGTGSTNVTSGDSFITPVAYTGTFANTAWTFSWVVRALTTGAIGRIRMRVWASVNADGSSPRELTSGTQVGSIVTVNALTTDFTSTISWSPGAITLSNEFLFFQIEWNETSLGSSSSSVVFWQSTALITTPNFSIPQPFFSNFFQVTAADAWPTSDVAVLTASQINVGIAVNNPPQGNAPKRPSVSLSIGSWEPDLSLYEHFGANGPYKARQLYPQLLAIAVNNPPVIRIRTQEQVAGTWQPDPAAWQFFGAPAPFMHAEFLPPVFTAIVNNPPIAGIRVQEQVNGTWQADPAAFEFFGGCGPFIPRTLPASFLAIVVNAPPPALAQTERPYDNWWIPADPSPQLTVKKSQAPPNPPFWIPAPSTWAILTAWNPPDAQAPIAGNINPVLLAIAVNNQPVTTSADNQLVAGGYWPALPDPNPTLPRYLPASVTAVEVDNPPVSSNADNQLVAGGYWPALPDPNPTLPPLLPVSIYAVRIDNPPLSIAGDNQLAAGGYWPAPFYAPLFQTQLTTSVEVDNPPPSSDAFEQLAIGGYWPALPDPNPTLPRYLIPRLIGAPPWSAAALYETIVSSWTTPDPQVLPPRLNPVFEAVAVNNPPIAGLNGDNQLAAGGYWPPLPDPLPILRRLLPVSIIGSPVNNPPFAGLNGDNQLAAGGYWPVLPDPNPTLPRYLPVSAIASMVSEPPSTQSVGTTQLAAGGYWPALPDPLPILPRYLPASVTASTVNNPPLGVFSFAPDQLGVCISWAWEAVKVTVLFGNQITSNGPIAEVDNPPTYSYVSPYETILGAWEPPPPPLVANTTPPVTAPYIPPPSGQPFGNSASLQVFATFGPVATSLTWLQLPPALLGASVSNPSFGGAPDATQAILAYWQQPDPAPILPRLPVQRFVPAVQLISEVGPLETILALWWEPQDQPQQKVKRRSFFTPGVPTPPVPPRELVEVIASWRANRESWPADTPAPVVARPLSPAISAVPVNNPPSRTTDQAGIAISWLVPDPWIEPVDRVNPTLASVPLSNPPFAGGKPANLAGLLSGAWAVPDPWPRLPIPPLPVRVDPSVAGRARLAAFLYATWAAPDVPVQPRVLLPQPSAVFVPRSVPQDKTNSLVLNSWAEPPPAAPQRTLQVQGTGIFLPSFVPPSPLETILESSWAAADLPPTLARLQVPPTQIGGQNARVGGQAAVVLAAWQDGPPLIFAQRFLPSGTAAVVVSPAIMTGAYLANLMAVLSFWVPSSFDPWFTGIPLGQPLPPPIAPIPHGTAVYEALGSPHELGSVLRAGLGALSRS